jgi:hypothetical protein
MNVNGGRGRHIEFLERCIRQCSDGPGWYHSTPDFGRKHHLHIFSQKLKYVWENIWRTVVHINHLNNVSSNIFLSLAGDTPKNSKWWHWDRMNTKAIYSLIYYMYLSSLWPKDCIMLHDRNVTLIQIQTFGDHLKIKWCQQNSLTN